MPDIAHRHPKVHVRAVRIRRGDRFDAKHDFPLVGELEGVADKIRQHLPESKRIADRRSGTAGTACVMSSTCFWMTVARNVSVTSSSTSRKAERRLFELQLVGLDLREVEDVIEDAKQVARRRVGDADVLVRLRRRDRLRAPAPFMLMIAFIGVRIS